jgi:AcrR family transcriptional regulator
MPRPSSRAPSLARRRPAAKRHYRSSEERREQIVAATLDLLATRGVRGWTTQALAREIGASEAMLFKHFGSKDEILALALQRQAERMIERLGAYEPPADASAWAACAGLVLTLLRFVEETGGGPFVVLVASELGPELRDTAQRAMRFFRTRVVAFCRPARARLPRGVTPELVCDLAMAVVQSSILRWLIGESSRPPTALARRMLPVIGRALEGKK